MAPATGLAEAVPGLVFSHEVDAIRQIGHTPRQHQRQEHCIRAPQLWRAIFLRCFQNRTTESQTEIHQSCCQSAEGTKYKPSGNWSSPPSRTQCSFTSSAGNGTYAHADKHKRDT